MRNCSIKSVVERFKLESIQSVLSLIIFFHVPVARKLQLDTDSVFAIMLSPIGF